MDLENVSVRPKGADCLRTVRRTNRILASSGGLVAMSTGQIRNGGGAWATCCLDTLLDDGLGRARQGRLRACQLGTAGSRRRRL